MSAYGQRFGEMPPQQSGLWNTAFGSMRVADVPTIAARVQAVSELIGKTGLNKLAVRRQGLFRWAAVLSAVALVCGVASTFASSTDSPSMVKSMAWSTATGARKGLDATLYSGLGGMVRELRMPGDAAKVDFAGWHDADTSDEVVDITTQKAMRWDDADCPDDEYCNACNDASPRTYYSAVAGLMSMVAAMITNYRRSEGIDTHDLKLCGIVTGLTSFAALMYSVLNFSISCFGENIDSLNNVAVNFQQILGPGWHLMLFAALVNAITSVVHLLTPVLNAVGAHDLATRLTSRAHDAMSLPAYSMRRKANNNNMPDDDYTAAYPVTICSSHYNNINGVAPRPAARKFAPANVLARSSMSAVRPLYPSATTTAVAAAYNRPTYNRPVARGAVRMMSGSTPPPDMSRSGPMTLDQKCVNSVRFLAVDGVNKANSGHPGAPMGQAPIGYVLYGEEMKHNPKNPFWVNRDRFVLSSGHGCMLQYSLLHLCGYDDVTMKDLQSFRQWGSKTPGHPENFETQGIEVTTGPLGMGISNAVGLAMAEAHLAATYNKPGHEVIDHYTYTIAGDGCFQEGVSHEACSLAGHLKLGKLIAFYDDNNITIDGETSLSFTEDVGKRYEAYGWQVLEVADGNNDVDGIRAAIAAAKAETGKPTLIKVKTIIGYGAPNKANSHDAHGAPLGADEAQATRDTLGWEYGEFEVPEDALSKFRSTIDSGAQLETEWNAKVEAYKAAFPELGAQFQDNVVDAKLPEGWADALPSYGADDKAFATRINSQKAINALASVIPGFIGGSADLAPSNMTLMAGTGDFLAGQYENKNLRFGVREFGMGAISNAIALHKTGLVPYCATFTIFTDYMRNAIRIAALSQAGTIFVTTHDSVALGEDGPTHQPIETIMSLRIIPQLAVVRPCDGNETSGAYKMAVRRSIGMGEAGISGKPKSFPTFLALSRQVLPNQPGSSIDAVEKGAYPIDDCEGTPDVILLATGSEVQLAIDAKAAMAGKKVRVVSMPCWEFFEDQDDAYKASVLPAGVPTVSVEAGVTTGWQKYAQATVGIDRFGASAPGGKAMEELGMTVDAVVAAANSIM